VGTLSPWHWAILLIVVVVLFGSKKLPDAARSLGKSMRIFKSEIKELQHEGQPETPVTKVQSERVEPPAADGRPV
jgi:sec-independent protein translocase protein TatA